MKLLITKITLKIFGTFSANIDKLLKIMFFIKFINVYVNSTVRAVSNMIDFYPISLKWSKIYLRQEMTGYAFVTKMSRTWASPRDILISNSCSLSLFEASENIFESTCGTRVGTGRKDHIGIRFSFNDFTFVPKGPFGAVHLNLPSSRCSNKCLTSRI